VFEEAMTRGLSRAPHPFKPLREIFERSMRRVPRGVRTGQNRATISTDFYESVDARVHVSARDVGRRGARARGGR